jgi:(R)-2-hydroxyacyl-CoA dehydratese activating ATPase
MFAGCDLGTVSVKVVITNGPEIVATEILPYKNLPQLAVKEAMDNALKKADLTSEDIDFCAATGFGKKAVPFADKESPEVVCLNRAFRRLYPEVRTIVDIGGQSMRAINLNDRGKVLDSTANEKCASGTGKFIEVMGRALEMSLDQMSQLPVEAAEPLPITSQCGVFAESEVITYVNDGKESADIAAGIALSVANKISSLTRRITLTEKLALVGGVALNAGVVKYINSELKMEPIALGQDPRLFAALGAAIIAEEQFAAKS